MWFEPGLEVPILEVPIGDTSLEGLMAIGNPECSGVFAKRTGRALGG